MDLGIQNRKAIVCASSRGLGRACAEALAREGVHVTLNARESEPLREAVDAIAAAHGVEVDGIPGDIYDAMKASIAAGRLGRPEEVGDACAFLCSAQSGFTSGQNLQLDGASYAGLI